MRLSHQDFLDISEIIQIIWTRLEYILRYMSSIIDFQRALDPE